MQKGKKVPEDIEKSIRIMYANGKGFTIQEMVKYLHLNYSTIKRIVSHEDAVKERRLKKLAYQREYLGRIKRINLRRLSMSERREIEERVKELIKTHRRIEVCNILGLAPSTVAHMLTREKSRAASKRWAAEHSDQVIAYRRGVAARKKERIEKLREEFKPAIEAFKGKFGL